MNDIALQCDVCEELGILAALKQPRKAKFQSLSIDYVLGKHDVWFTSDLDSLRENMCRLCIAFCGVLLQSNIDFAEGTLKPLVPIFGGYEGIAVLHGGRLLGRLRLKRNTPIFTAMSKVTNDPFPQQISRLFLLRCLWRCTTGHTTCSKQYKQIRAIEMNPAGDNLDILLVDVRKNKLVRKTPKTRYVALSYCWGNIGTKLQAKKSNVDVLLNKGLKAVNESVPKTIADAMQFVRMSMLRYLWVDQLCIVQDEEIDKKQEQIQAMDIIYSRAMFTIVAIDGIHADSGLPGIGSSTRDLRCRPLTTSHALITERFDLKPVYDISPWTTRGWTFQEGILSRRVMYFSRWGAWYQCESKLFGDYADDVYSSTFQENSGQLVSVNPATAIVQFVTPNLLEKAPKTVNFFFESYASLVKDYSRRRLSDPSDKLDAFAGVVSRCTKVTGDSLSHTYGMPLIVLDYGMLWTQDRGIQSNSHREEIPSWTWISSTGPCSYDFALSIIYCYQLAGKKRANSPIAVVAKTLPKDGIIQFDTKAVDGRRFVSIENTELANRMPFPLYSTLLARGSVCGFLVGLKPTADMPKESKFVRLTAPLSPSTQKDLYWEWVLCREWAEQVERGAESIVVVMVVKQTGKYFKRLGIGVIFWEDWERLPKDNLHVDLN